MYIAFHRNLEVVGDGVEAAADPEVEVLVEVRVEAEAAATARLLMALTAARALDIIRKKLLEMRIQWKWKKK